MRKTMNYSEKRQAILDTLHATKEHPSAEMIYHSLKPRFPRLSLGTVYRNLQEFKRDRAAVSIAVVDGQERVDGNTSEHTHFICDKCSAVIDLDIPIPADIGNNAIDDGYQVTARQLFLRGSCPKCASKELHL